MSSQPGANATPREKKLSKRSFISRSASSKSNLTGSKKNLDCSIDRKRQMIEPGHNSIGTCRQCELIGLSRVSLYYEPAEESAENLLLMRLLDEQYTRTPFYGVLKMTAWLRENGHPVNCKRVRRLLRLMGLEAIYQKPRLSIPSPGHQVYPYLLRGMKVTRVNQVWSADITYIRLLAGFVYLVAIIDWNSQRSRNRHQYGWARSSAGQHLRRTTLAQRQIRRGLLARLPEHAPSHSGLGKIFQILQW